MKHIVAVLGVRGAGKSTLLRSLNEFPHVKTLQPTTNRPKRGEEEEYEFISTFPRSDGMAWEIEVGDYSYGVRNKQVKDIPDGCVGVTVFHPGSIEVLEEFRQRWTGEVVTIGLDTITSLDEQRARVDGDTSRQMSSADFESEITQVRKADFVIRGDAVRVLNATKAVCELLVSRGGLVGKNWLVPLIRAGSLLDNAQEEGVQPASYDLRLGCEVWCQGKRHELTDHDPFFRIPPYSYAIVKAEESARIPCFIAGRFDLTVSLFFKGVLLSNGPQVDPGYNGALFCTLFNGRDVHADLKMGQHFATLEFCVLGTRVDGYTGQHQNKNDLNAFLEAETGAGPGGNIVGRIEELERESKGRLVKVFLVLVALIAVPSGIQLWMINGFRDRATETLEQVKSDVDHDLETILKELPQDTAEARKSLAEESIKLDRLRAEIDAMHQRIELLGKDLKRLEENEALPSNDAEAVLPSTDPNR